MPLTEWEYRIACLCVCIIEEVGQGVRNDFCLVSSACGHPCGALQMDRVGLGTFLGIKKRNTLVM